MVKSILKGSTLCGLILLCMSLVSSVSYGDFSSDLNSAGTARPIGGGNGYDYNTVAPPNSWPSPRNPEIWNILNNGSGTDYIEVTTVTGLETAINNVNNGGASIIYIPGHVVIDVTSLVTDPDDKQHKNIVTEDNVMIVSNRGQEDEDGIVSLGALLHISPAANPKSSVLTIKGNNCRVTGLRIAGCNDGRTYPGESRGPMRGITVSGDGVEIDNYEIIGFLGDCITLGAPQ